MSLLFLKKIGDFQLTETQTSKQKSEDAEKTMSLGVFLDFGE